MSRPIPIRTWEIAFMLVVLSAGAIVIGVLLAATGIAHGVMRAVIAIMHDPNAGPYRQVR